MEERREILVSREFFEHLETYLKPDERVTIQPSASDPFRPFQQNLVFYTYDGKTIIFKMES